METFPPIVWVLAIMAAVLVAIRVLLSRGRRQMFIDFAGIRKWQLKPSARNLDREFGDVIPFNRGRKRRSTNILIFTIGESSGLSLDYSLVDDTPDGPAREFFHVVGVNLARELPTITVTKDGEEWIAETETAKYRRRIMTPKVTAWLDSPDNHSTNFTISRAVLFTYARGKQDIDQVDPMVASLRGFAEQLPASLWQDGSTPVRDN